MNRENGPQMLLANPERLLLPAWVPRKPEMQEGDFHTALTRLSKTGPVEYEDIEMFGADQPTRYRRAAAQNLLVEELRPYDASSFEVTIPIKTTGGEVLESMKVDTIYRSITRCDPMGPFGIGVLYALTKAQERAANLVGMDKTERRLKVYQSGYKKFRELCIDNHVYLDTALAEQHNYRTPVAVLDEMFAKNGQLFANKEKRAFAIAQQFVALHESAAHYLEYLYYKNNMKDAYLDKAVQRLGLDPKDYHRQQVMRKLLDATDIDQTLSDIYPIDEPVQTADEIAMMKYNAEYNSFANKMKQLLMVNRILSTTIAREAAFVQFTNETMNPRDTQRNRATRFSEELYGIVMNDSVFAKSSFEREDREEIAFTLEQILATGVPHEFFCDYVDPETGRYRTISTETQSPLSAMLVGDKMETIFPPRVVIYEGDTCIYGNEHIGQETARIYINRHHNNGLGTALEYANDRVQLEKKNDRLENCPAPLVLDVDIFKDKIGIRYTSDHRFTHGNEIANYVATRFAAQLHVSHTTSDIPLYLPKEQGLSLKKALLAALPPESVFEDFNDQEYTPWTFLLPAKSVVKFRQLAKQHLPHCELGIGSLMVSFYSDILQDIQAKRTNRKNKNDVTVSTLVSSSNSEIQVKMVNVSMLNFEGAMSNWLRVINGKLTLDPLLDVQQREFTNAIHDNKSKRNQLRTVQNVFHLPRGTWKFIADISLGALAEHGRREVGEATFSPMQIQSSNKKLRMFCGPALIPEWTNMAYTGTNVEENGLIPFVAKMKGNQVEVRKFLAQLIENICDLDEKNLAHLLNIEQQLKTEVHHV